MRELSHVRLQKLIKVLDTYKKGKIYYDDWSTGLRMRDSKLEFSYLRSIHL